MSRLCFILTTMQSIPFGLGGGKIEKLSNNKGVTHPLLPIALSLSLYHCPLYMLVCWACWPAYLCVCVFMCWCVDSVCWCVEEWCVCVECCVLVRFGVLKSVCVCVHVWGCVDEGVWPARSVGHSVCLHIERTYSRTDSYTRTLSRLIPRQLFKMILLYKQCPCPCEFRNFFRRHGEKQWHRAGIKNNDERRVH